VLESYRPSRITLRAWQDYIEAVVPRFIRCFEAEGCGPAENIHLHDMCGAFPPSGRIGTPVDDGGCPSSCRKVHKVHEARVFAEHDMLCI
jgi:hypothetical protein